MNDPQSEGHMASYIDGTQRSLWSRSRNRLKLDLRESFKHFLH